MFIQKRLSCRKSIYYWNKRLIYRDRYFTVLQSRQNSSQNKVPKQWRIHHCLNAVYSKKKSTAIMKLNHTNHIRKCCPLQLQQYKRLFISHDLDEAPAILLSSWVLVDLHYLLLIHCACCGSHHRQGTEKKKNITQGISIILYSNCMTISVFLPMSWVLW